MFSDSRRALFSAQVSTPVDPTPILIGTYTTSGSFTVPSGYSSFKIELIGGKGGDYVEASTGNGGQGAKVTFIVPVSDMPVGSTQTYTIGTNGHSYDYYVGGASQTNGTATVFKGMTAGGGDCGKYDGYDGGDDGANGTASGTTYTNTTPNNAAFPPSMKVYGMAAQYQVTNKIAITDTFIFNTNNIPIGTQIDASGHFGNDNNNVTNLSGSFPLGYYFYFNNAGVLPLTLFTSSIFNPFGDSYMTIFSGENWRFVKTSTDWECTNVSKTYQNIQIITASTTFTPPASTMFVTICGSSTTTAHGAGLACALLTNVAGSQPVVLTGSVNSFGGYLSATNATMQTDGIGLYGTTNITGYTRGIVEIRTGATNYTYSSGTHTLGSSPMVIVQW